MVTIKTFLCGLIKVYSRIMIKIKLSNLFTCFILIFFIFPVGISAQNSSLAGTVKDMEGNPLIGVNVVEKNTTNGTVTDVNGNFSISVPGNATLIFTYIGFASHEELLNGRNFIEVVLSEDAELLDEVVVIGYGESSKRNLSTAIANLKATDVSARNVSSATQMLQGQLPGVNVMLSNGLPGSRSNINIRGISSINGDNQPLYVVDGIQLSKASGTTHNTGEYVQDPLSMINPADIESIDVLKDAAASAIYGSRATNGVVIINTKKGKNSKPRVTLSQLTGFQKLPRKLDLLTSDEYIALQKEAVENYNTGLNLVKGNKGYIDINKVLGKVPADYYDVNWQDLILNDNALSTQTDLSFVGGNQNVKAFASVGYFNQEGLLKQTGLKRYSIRSNVDYDVNRFMAFGLRLNGNYTKASQQPNGNQGTALFQRSLEQRPYDRVYKEDGSYMIGGKDILRHNGVQVLNSESNVDDNYQLLLSFFGDVKFLKYFTFRSTLNSELRHGFGFRHLTMTHPYAFGKGATYELNSNRFMYNLENTLSYSDRFYDKLNIDVLLGQSFLNESYKYLSTNGTLFPSDDFVHISDATDIVADGNKTQYALSSIFGRFQLNYDNKYYLSGSVRRDGSSRFSKDNRYDVFPAVSAAWTFSKEDAFRFNDKFSFGKLRLSWGKTGNQEGIGNFSYLPLASGGYNYDNNSGLAITSPGNEKLKWETSSQFNVGLDLGFLSDRLFIKYDFFNKKTNDLLYNIPLLSTSGFTSKTENIGSMRNIGHELSIDTKNIQRDDFRWNTSFNISFINNKVTELIDEKPISVSGYNALIVGEPIGVFYAYKQEGIFQNKEEIPEKMYNQGVRPGDMKFKDVDGNDIINSSDLVVLGSPQPKFFGGLTNKFYYKDFDLSIFMNYAYGNKIAAVWRGGLDAMGANDYNAVSMNYDKRWTGPGTSNLVPRATKSGYNTKASTYYLEDGSFLKLKNITLGYNFDQHLLKRTGINSLRLYASVSDLLKFTKYSGYDPEASSSNDAKVAGQDNLVTPKPISFLFGINLNF